MSAPQKNDLNELFAIMLFDTKLSGHALVIAFFKTFPDLQRLHREVTVSHAHPLFCCTNLVVVTGRGLYPKASKLVDPL